MESDGYRTSQFDLWNRMDAVYWRLDYGIGQMQYPRVLDRGAVRMPYLVGSITRQNGCSILEFGL